MRYIKANKEVVKILRLENLRPLLPDGNYLIWDRDLLVLGSSDSFGELIPALGCRELTAQEVRAEQEGGEPADLPEPTDPRIAVNQDNEEGGEK